MIGQTVYVFDANRRVYRKDGKVSTGPIWREHWQPVEVRGETSRSWVLSDGRKIPKKPSGYQTSVCYTEGDLNERVWAHENRYDIIERVRQCGPGALRSIDELLRQAGV